MVPGRIMNGRKPQSCPVRGRKNPLAGRGKQPPCGTECGWWRGYRGCQSGSVCSCPATGTIPFVPVAQLPSTANGLNEDGSKQDLYMASTSKAEQQSEQQRSNRQRGAQRLEAVQFGVGIACGGFDWRHGELPVDGLMHIKPPARALAPAESGRPAAAMWRNAGKGAAWLAYARPA